MPPSPPSLQPPMNWPLTNTCGTLVLPVNALSSAFWTSVTSTSLNSIPASLATEAPDSVILSPRYLIGAVAAQEPLQGFVGTIDDVRFYDRSLSHAEVATLFHDTSTPPDQG